MFCSNCGSKIDDEQIFCGACGTKNFQTDPQPAKPIDQSMVSNPPNYQPVKSDNQSNPLPPNYGQTPNYRQPNTYPQYASQPSYYMMPPTREFFLWLILGICTLGIGSLVYLYHNFNDVRKLEMIRIQQSQNRVFMNQTKDPWIGLIAYFVCSPIAYVLKYSNLNNYINFYGDRYQDPVPASSEKLLGIWILTFVSFIFGFLFIPLLLVAIILIFYSVYLEKEWQDSLNFQIIKMSG